jgi:hypothetical protein
LYWGLALAGGLTAACVVVLTVAPREDSAHQPERRAEIPLPRPSGFDDSRPALNVYQRALAGPPANLDALLNKHAAGTLPPGLGGPPMRAFALTGGELGRWTGEL